MKKLQSTLSKKNCLKHQSGFTLIEVLVGITILTIGLLGVAKMQISAIQGNYMSSSTSVALALAQEKMEELMVLSYTDDLLDDREDDGVANNDEAVNLMPITNTTDVDHEETVTTDAQGTFRRIWNIADHPLSGEPNVPTMKSITVIVTWDNGKHQLSLFCLRR